MNKSLIASLVALALGLSPAAAEAAGLGRLTVKSAIGQPLRAEIDLVSVRADEVSSLAARVASPDAYRNANIQFNPALLGARATIERRPGGSPYIRVTSNRPVEEPYIDLLVELTWNTGRLVREYTALIDPPGFNSGQAPVASAAFEARPVPAAEVVAPVTTRTRAVAARPVAAGPRTYTVQSGDTLNKIATEVQPEGVSLEQVLVGIYRNNRDAFINDNMNLMRSGRILRIPDASELAAVPDTEARSEVRLHVQNWNAYRQRVAAEATEVPASEPRAAAGRITPRVEEAAPEAQPGKEVVKVSKGAPGAESGAEQKDLQERIRNLEEEVIAREKTLKDANDRIAALEKTIADMQRLLEMKGVPVPPAAVAPPSPPSAPPAEVAKADDAGAAPKPAEPEAAASGMAPAPDAVAEAKPEAAPSAAPAAGSQPEVSAPPAAAPRPEAAKPEPAAPAAPAPVADNWWSDTTVLGGALVALGLVGGLAYVTRRRRRNGEVASAEPGVHTAAEAPAAGADAASVESSPDVTTEMPAVAPTAAPADDVDPIQEADVYIAYGRDAQAEEILKEAAAKDPNRQEIKLKLLEIYAARKSRNDFNPLAEDLHKATQGRGDVWLKAATMGFALDPDNPLYAAGKDSTIVNPVGVATDVNLDFDLDMVASGAPTTRTGDSLATGEDSTVKTMALSPERMEQLRAEGEAAAKKQTDTQPIVPDVDLGAESAAVQTDITLEPGRASGPITDVNLEVPPTVTESNVIDFEFDPDKTIRIEPAATQAFDQTVAVSPENQENARDLGVEIDLGALDAPAPTLPQGSTTSPIGSDEATADISFDFELPSETPPTVTMEVPEAPLDAPATEIRLDVPPTDLRLDLPEDKPVDTSSVDFALDAVSLDLDGEKTPQTPAAPAHDDHWYDVQTKFDLAKAYQEMGDKEGAREILAEVIKEGDAQQQAEANEMLAKLD